MAASTDTARSRIPGPRPWWKSPRRLVVIGLCLALVVAVAGIGATTIGLPIGSRTTNAATTDYQIVPSTQGSIEGWVSASGPLALVSSTLVTPKGSGIVRSLDVGIGDEVTVGQPIAVLDTSDLKADLVQAELDLDTAEAKLDQSRHPYTEADIIAAQAAVESAKVKLEQAQNPYTEGDVAGAEMAVEQAHKNLETARTPYTESEIQAQRDAVKQAEVSLQSARYDLVNVQKSDTVSKNVRDREYEETFYESAYGKALDGFNKGEVTRDKVTLEWNNLMTAKERLDSARAQSASALLSAQNQVTQAETSLSTAREELATMEAGPDASDVRSAQLALTQAEAKLAQIEAGPKAADVQAAKVSLSAAEQSLADKMAGPDELTVRIAQNDVNSAQATVEDLQEQIAATVITSPIEGSVVGLGDSTITPSVGMIVTETTPLATISDIGNLQVQGSVNEVDAAQVKRGQTAEIVLAALSGQSLPGKVVSVDTQATISQGVSTYGVIVSVDSSASSAAGLKPGMTATVRILTGRSDKAVLVPIEALQKVRGNWSVLVADQDGVPKARTVSIGIIGSSDVEITKGLRPGEQVAIPLRQQNGGGAQQQQQLQRAPANFSSAPAVPGSGQRR